MARKWQQGNKKAQEINLPAEVQLYYGGAFLARCFSLSRVARELNRKGFTACG